MNFVIFCLDKRSDKKLVDVEIYLAKILMLKVRLLRTSILTRVIQFGQLEAVLLTIATTD